nr:hypothetical protein [Tanacetum cinerariifolium]
MLKGLNPLLILLWMIRRMHPNRMGIIAEIDADGDVILEEVDAEKDAAVQGRQEESQAQAYHIDLEHADKVLSMQNDKPEPAELKEVIEVVTIAKLMTEVVTAATTITTAPITAATITATPSVARRRKGVVIRDPEETATPSTIVHSEPKSKDKRKGILVQEPKPLKKQAHIEKDEVYARELEVELNKNINWDDVIEQVKRKEKEDIVVLRYQALKRKPQTEAQARKNMMHFNFVVGFLEKSEKELEEEETRALKRKSKSSKQQAAKKQKFDEEVEELKKHLQIVPNDEDDVYTEATPLALKVNIKFRGGLLGLNNVLISCMLMMFSLEVDAVEDFKEYTLRDYYCWLKTYCCWYKLKLLDDAADSRLRLLEQSAAVDDKMKK